MLDALRRGSTGWVAKILLLVPLLFAFAIWGIGDVIRRQSGAETLAYVGKSEIGVEQFRQAFQMELSNLSQRIRRRLTPDEARMFGLDSQVLSRLVGTTALDLKTHELGLTQSDKSIADAIRSEPGLQGADGKFSRAAFDAFLRQIGLTEKGYVAQRRAEDLREQLTESMTAGVVVPQIMIDTLHRYREETRVIEHVTVDAEKLGVVAEPDDAKLTAYFEIAKSRYGIPESKQLSVLLLTNADAAKKIAVSDEDIKATFEAEKEKLSTPEKRRVQQLSFPDKGAAETAYAALAKAANFVEAAAKLGFKESDFDLGQVVRRDLIDAKVADAAFAAKRDELSPPVEGQFTTVLVRVTEIIAGKEATFEEAKGKIKDRLASERAVREIQAIHDKVEDERSAGKSLKEIAAKLELAQKEIPAVDKSGKTPEGKPVADVAEVERIALAAFGGSAGNDADAVQLADGGYAWVDVLATTPEKQKPFDTVKAEVRTAYLEVEKQKAVAAETAKLVDRLGKGETLAAIAGVAGGKIEKTNAITRATVPQGLSQNAVAQAFTLAKGGAISTASADNKSRTIMTVADVIAAAAPTLEQTDKLKRELVQQIQTDLLNAYITGLQNQYGVTINQAAVRQAIGGAAAQ